MTELSPSDEIKIHDTIKEAAELLRTVKGVSEDALVSVKFYGDQKDLRSVAQDSKFGTAPFEPTKLNKVRSKMIRDIMRSIEDYVFAELEDLPVDYDLCMQVKSQFGRERCESFWIAKR